MIEKHGKPSADILKIKNSFFSDNEKLLNENLDTAILYKSQNIRKNCKNCGETLNELFFTKHNIDYYLCQNCNHLNGGHEETQNFANKIYINPDYAKNYKEQDRENYHERVRKIYLPKANFLSECLNSIGLKPSKLSYLDVGAGSGYFIYSLQKELGIKNVRGVEVSPAQVDYGNIMLGHDLIENIQLGDLSGIIKSSEDDVISLIGVLEHIINPDEILCEIRDNNYIKFCYISLPLFSYSTFFELVNQNCYNRHLGGAHTHLYTLDSVDWLCKKYNFKIIGKWSFGTDMMDLFRFMTVNMNGLEISQNCRKFFSEKFLAIIDNLQLMMDESGFCSEVQLVLQKY